MPQKVRSIETDDQTVSSQVDTPPMLLDMNDLTWRTRLCRSQIYALMAQEKFPKPSKIGRSSRWDARCIQRWVDSLSDQSAAS